MDLENRKVQQYIARGAAPGGWPAYRWRSYWYDFDQAVSDLKAMLDADSRIRWGYVVDPESGRLFRAHRKAVA